MATYQFKINLPKEKTDYLEKLYKDWKDLARKKRKGIASILNQEIEAIWSDKERRPPNIYSVPFRWDKIYIYVEISNQTDHVFIKEFLSNKFLSTKIHERIIHENDLIAYNSFDTEAERNKENEFAYKEDELAAIKKMGNCIETYFLEFNLPGDDKKDMVNILSAFLSIQRIPFLMRSMIY